MRRSLVLLLVTVVSLTAAAAGSTYGVTSQAAVACGASDYQGDLWSQPSSTAMRNQVAFKVEGGVSANQYYLYFGDRTPRGTPAGSWLRSNGAILRRTYPRPGEYTAVLWIQKPGCSGWARQLMSVVANPVYTYAPTMVFHPDEEYFPDSTDGFLDAAVLVHDLPNYHSKLSSEGCRDNVMAVGSDADLDKFADQRDNTRVGRTEPDLDQRRLGSAVRSRAYGADNYSIRYQQAPPPYPIISEVDDCNKGRSDYLSHENGATKAGSKDSDDDGLVLSLAGAPKSVLKGDTGLDSASIYVDYQSGRYIAYWFFYPYNDWRIRKANHDVIGEQHEGDWEHIVVRLGDARSPTMRDVGYFQHYCSLDPYSRSQISDQLDYGTHPTVYVAKGGHASYPRPRKSAFTESCSDELRMQGFGDDTGSGGAGSRVFRPWVSRSDGTTGLRLAERQAWYGYEGAWGDPGPKRGLYTLAFYGPKAPGAQSAGVPKSWKGEGVSLYSLGEDDPPGEAAPDLEDPSLGKPVVTPTAPASRIVNYSLDAYDDIGVTEMRVKATGDEDWRPWVEFHPTGTVVLPDRYGDFTVWFQVRDAEGHVSLERAADNVTRVQDSGLPTITSATVTHPGDDSPNATFQLAASDSLSSVTSLRAFVNGEPRAWVPFKGSGTVSLADGWGTFGIGFEVMDESGNVSERTFAGAVNRRAPVTLAFDQVDNNDNVRSCGGTETTPCSAAVRKFRTTIGSAVSPDADLLLRAWRLVDGSWIATDPSPMLRSAINYRTSITLEVTADLLPGLWRFQSQVPVTGSTQFSSSEYQYLDIDTRPPQITSTSLRHDDPASQFVGFTLDATDDHAVTQMRAVVNGTPRPWNEYERSGYVVLPDGWGTFGIGFQVADASGNVSDVAFAGAVQRRAGVQLSMVQVDNDGIVRSCGVDEVHPCSSIVKRFRSTIDTETSPDADLLLKAWRLVDGTWVATDPSPLLRSPVEGRTSITLEVTDNLLPGLWRFQAQVPVTDATQFASSAYQYLQIDTRAPQITATGLSHPDPASQFVGFTLAAGDDVGVTQMRAVVNGEPRPWNDYAESGTVVLPDGWGNFGIGFQVRDASGNVSDPTFAGTVQRQAEVALALQQVDNNGNVRSCGSVETSPCSDVVKKFRTTISTQSIPDADLLFKAWRLVDGTWVETDPSPMLRSAINGRISITFEITANLLPGLWRFKTQTPVTVATQFASSEYQYLTITAPDTTAPTVTGHTLSHSDPASQFVGFTLSASDNVGVTQMRALVNGEPRSWTGYATSGTVVLPDGWGNFGIGFQVMDGAGNVSDVSFAGTVTRLAQVNLTLQQVDNNGNVRSCGSVETSPCSDVVKKFRTTISSQVSPNADLLLKAWRKINGAWTESSVSPFMREAINGRTQITQTVTANLLAGLWRFQTQVPTTASSQFGASGYQYLQIG